MINHIFFDLDDTLFPSSEFAALARNNAIRAMIRMGLHATEEELLARLGRIITKKGSNYPGHFDELLKTMDGDIAKNPARYVAAAIGAYHDTKAAIQPYPEVPATLLELRECGYKLYIATNGLAVKQWDKLIRLDLALYFNEVFVSEELGLEKNGRFFARALREIGAKPKDCVMVGDREETDIKAAKKAGLHTIRVLRGKYARTPTRADAKIKDFHALQSTVLKLSG